MRKEKLAEQMEEKRVKHEYKEKKHGDKAYKSWNIMTVGITAATLIFAAVITIVIDPFFHYHKPSPWFQYPIENERYSNDGIIKHFDYDAVITGSSMTENFKVTEFDTLWGTKSIKIPFSGASYKEINDNVSQILKYKPDTRYILRGLDRNSIFSDKDRMRYEESFYPRYLYDEKWFNDLNYILNKSVLFKEDRKVLLFTANGGTTTTFDEYMNWNSSYTFGKTSVLETYTRPEQTEEKTMLSPQERKQVEENIEQNVTRVPRQHPEVTFYYFFTPYSICYWDSVYRSGELSRSLEAEQIAVEMILEVENIKLYAFEDCFDLICNLDNYKDIAHYGEHVNSQILRWIRAGEHRLTKSNYQDYLEKMELFYRNYPYDAIFSEG